MRSGLRLQILLLLGGLLVLAFVPLHYALAIFSGIAVQRLQESSARTLGRAVASHVAEARHHRAPHQVASLIAEEVGAEGVEAIGLYDQGGVATLRAGEPASAAALPPRIDPRKAAVEVVSGAHGRAIAVYCPDAKGAVVAVVRTDAEATQLMPLVRLFGLYMAVVALALLVAAYIALTQLIVRPVDAIASAAERVAGGARRFDVAAPGPRELAELARNLRAMTDRLLANEDSLQARVLELASASRELQQAHARLVRSERLASVGRLAAGLAHEVGNPIAAMLGLLELLTAGGLTPDEERDFLGRLRRETERIHGILRDLLAFARPSTPRPDAPPEPGDVRTAADEVTALLAPQRALSDVRFRCEIEANLPMVTLPREQLVQVLLNLILNAADACGEGGSITVRARRAAAPELGSAEPPASATDAARVVLEVEDDGPGVAPTVLEHLFEPFVTTKEIGKGTGLGLAVCRGLVEGAGGTIALDGALPRGARFVIELPAA